MTELERATHLANWFENELGVDKDLCLRMIPAIHLMLTNKDFSRESLLLSAHNIELADRGDGVEGHFCIRRTRKDGYAEYWNDGILEWTAFGTLYIGRDVAVDEAMKLIAKKEEDKPLLKEGDVIEITEGHSVYADVPEHLVYTNKAGCFDMAHCAITVSGELSYFAGKYVVVKTAIDGGGYGRDQSPGGHHVYCVGVGENKRKIDFFQTGSFTAMIKNIRPIGRAELSWNIVE